MVATTTIATIGALASVGGTLYSMSQQRKASRAGAAAAAKQQQQQELRAARSRRQAFRELQISRARARASAAAMGAGDSSALAGGLASLSSQYGATLGYSGAMTGLSREISQLGIQQQTALMRAQTGSSIAGFGFQAMQNPAGFTQFKNLFK
jgi:hypothetical protein